jgi:uncharacterized membrane protein
MTRDPLHLAGAAIAVGLIALLGYCTHALIHTTVPPENKDPLLVVIGILSMNVGAVISYFFGNTADRKRQSDTIEKLADTAKAVQAASMTPPDVLLPPGQTVTVEASTEG